MIDRDFHLREIKKRLKSNQVVALLGPRQSGKTTLAKQFKSHLFYDLERPEDLVALDYPAQAFRSARGLIVIDEIQRRPDLFTFLRYFVDQNKSVRFLILGSSSRELLRQSSESLAGRISYYQIGGFTLDELGNVDYEKLWLRGGFPKSYLARNDSLSRQWRIDYTRTFLEQDIPQLGIQIPAPTLRRFWQMLAHYNGQILNYSEIGKNFGASDTTIKKYIDILTGTFVTEVVSPWHANIAKRQVKSPKFYFKDTGLFHYLADIVTRRDLLSHPKLGSSWETFVLQTLRFRVSDEIYFWNTQANAEIDFLIRSGRNMIGVEAKFSDAPKITPSMKIALKDLALQRILVVYPGDKSYSLSDQIKVIPLQKLNQEISK